MTNLTDGLRQRSPAAWREACHQHVSELYGFVFRLVRGEQSLAEDLVQEIWLEAIERIEHFDSARGELRGWLFEIARRRVALHWRKWLNQARILSEIAGTDGETVDGALLPSAAIEQLEQSAVVRAALLSMSAERRAALTDKYLEGLSVDQMAAKSGKTPKAVESLLTRSRQQLRERLHPYFAEATTSPTPLLPSPGSGSERPEKW